MPSKNDADKTSSEKTTTQKIVPILVVVAIGIPVLIELMTLFNLLNVHLISEDDDKPSEQTGQMTEVRQVSEGDTLLLAQQSPVIVDKMVVKVGAQEWDFELRLVYPDSTVEQGPKIQVDSLLLQQNNMIRTPTNLDWSRNDGVYPYTEAEWKLPTGKVPEILYISSFRAVSQDFTEAVQQEVQLGRIPVRYERQ